MKGDCWPSYATWGALGDNTDRGGRDRSAVVGIGKGSNEWAGYFDGDVKVTGKLEAQGVGGKPWHESVDKYRCNDHKNRQWTFEDGFIPHEMQMHSSGSSWSAGTVRMVLVLDDNSQVYIDSDDGMCSTGGCGGWRGWKREWGIFSKIPNGRTVKAVKYHCLEDDEFWYGGIKISGINLGRLPTYSEWN